MRLFRLELKRVIKTRTTWILLAAALLISVLMAWLPVTFETRNVVEDGVEKELTGFDAIRVKRQAQAGIAGVITEAQLKAAAETAVRVLREYEKEYMYQLPTEVYVEKILPVAPLLPEYRRYMRMRKQVWPRELLPWTRIGWIIFMRAARFT